MDNETRRRWHNMLAAAMVDREMSGSEKDYLEKMRGELGITPEEARQIVDDYKTGKGGIEISGSRDEKLAAFKDIINVFVSDGLVSEKEKEMMGRIAE
ncbi:MAG: TerB family tellurite resistance protein, partial [Planctomycetes bacterium]|nr:TerB family tellurite resistance protein [Planctomycetota bacterium]